MFQKVMRLEKQRHELLHNLAYQVAKLSALTRRQHEWAAMLREKAEAQLNAEDVATCPDKPTHEHFGLTQEGSTDRTKVPKQDEHESSAEKEKLLVNLRKASREIEGMVQRAGKTQAQLEKVGRQTAKLISNARRKQPR